MGAKEWEEIASHEFKMIQKLIETVHISMEENRNIYIPSTKEKYAMVLQNQEWALVNKSEFMEKLVQDKGVLFYEILKKYGKEFVKVDPHRTRGILKLCTTDDEEEIKKVLNDSLLLLFNGNILTKNTFETRYNKKIKAR